MKYRILTGGIVGVPITFLDKFVSENNGGGTSRSEFNQFKIIKFRKGNDDKDLSVNGVCPYFRVLVRRKI